MRLCGRLGNCVLAGWLWLVLLPGVPVWALEILRLVALWSMWRMSCRLPQSSN